MSSYSLYPGFVKIRYTGNGHVHYQTLPVRPYQAVGGDWLLVQKSDVIGEEWTSWVDTYAALYKTFLNTADEVQVAHLWSFPDEDSDPVFIAEYALALAGTNAGAAVPYGQLVFTMRTQAGGLQRLFIMEGYYPANQKGYPPFPAGIPKNYTDFCVGNDSAIVGRDGEFLSSIVSYTSKYNDALRKKFLLAQ